MAVLEHFVYGFNASDSRSRDVLARSPGLTDVCIREVIRLCEGWGAVPAEGLRRPVLLASPLSSSLNALSGRLYAVVRIGRGLRPVYHAVILTEGGYSEFGRNPYAVAATGVFIDSYESGQMLSRLETAALAPDRLVSPAPRLDETDGLVEALRLLLTEGTLKLPLEQASDESDRFLALVIAAIPGGIRRDLRFTSWAPVDTGRFQLVAAHREAALFRGWKPLLMSTPTATLPETAERYVTEARERLAAGDLDGLLASSARCQLQVGGGGSGGHGGPGGRKEPLTATMSPTAGSGSSSGRGNARGGVSPRAAVGDLGRRAAPGVGRRPTASGTPKRPIVPLRIPRPRRSSSGRRWLAGMLVTVVLAAGTFYIVHFGRWGRLPGVLGDEAVRLHANPKFGVVDVGRLYEDALRLLSKAHAGVPMLMEQEQRHSQEIISQAGQLLRAQGEAYLDQVDATLGGAGIAAGHEPEILSAATLEKKGDVLALEMRRLALASVSVADQIWWSDLAGLDRDELVSRYDSLFSVRNGRSGLSHENLNLDEMMRRVERTRLQVAALAQVRDLLDAPRWSETWLRELEAASSRLSVVEGNGARTWRRLARALRDLKRAEQVAAFGDRALDAREPAPAAWPRRVSEVLPDLGAALKRLAPAARPELVQETTEFYADLARGWALKDSAGVRELVGIVRGLRTSRAVRFDPAAYGDHVERLATGILASLLYRGVPPEEIPASLHPGGHDEETLWVLAADRAGTDAIGWRRLADRCQDPFFVRYADRRSREARRRAQVRSEEFSEQCEKIRGELADLAAAAREGGETGPELRSLARRAGKALRENPPASGFSLGVSPCRHRLQELVAVESGGADVNLGMVTLRFDQTALEEPTEVLIELSGTGTEPRRSSPITVGPAAPAGTGWVGTGDVDWHVAPTPGQRLAVRVVDARDERALVEFTYQPWLAGCEPASLTRPVDSGGARISWRLNADFWDRLRESAAD